MKKQSAPLNSTNPNFAHSINRQLRTVNYIILGQGLAGSLLAWELIKLRKDVVVVDNGAESSSRVAAGLFNPITGRRMTESWRVDELLPAAEKTYRDIEKALGISIYHPMPMMRLFPSAEEREANLKRVESFGSNKYVGHISKEWQANGLKPVHYGTCEVLGAGYLDTELFLTAFRDFLEKTERLVKTDVNYSGIILTETGARWENIEAKTLIFCEGFRAAENPWFSYLPWNLCKGELLTIHAPGLNSEAILSRGIYIVPLGNDKFRVGATYAWDEMNSEPTEAAANTLKKALDEIIDVPYTVIDHKAGVRPTVRHRRPFLGRHPEFPQLALFNGLGTKGVLLAPFFGKQMAEYLEGKGSLDKEVDIRQLASPPTPSPK